MYYYKKHSAVYQIFNAKDHCIAETWDEPMAEIICSSLEQNRRVDWTKTIPMHTVRPI